MYRKADVRFVRFLSSNTGITFFDKLSRQTKAEVTKGIAEYKGKSYIFIDGKRFEVLLEQRDSFLVRMDDSIYASIPSEYLISESGNIYYSEMTNDPVRGDNQLNLICLDKEKRIIEIEDKTISVKAIRTLDYGFTILVEANGDIYFNIVKDNKLLGKQMVFIGNSNDIKIPVKNEEYEFDADILISESGFESVNQLNDYRIKIKQITCVSKIEARFYYIEGILDNADKDKFSAYIQIPWVSSYALTNLLLKKDSYTIDDIQIMYDLPYGRILEISANLKKSKCFYKKDSVYIRDRDYCHS